MTANLDRDVSARGRPVDRTAIRGARWTRLPQRGLAGVAGPMASPVDLPLDRARPRRSRPAAGSAGGPPGSADRCTAPCRSAGYAIDAAARTRAPAAVRHARPGRGPSPPAPAASPPAQPRWRARRTAGNPAPRSAPSRRPRGARRARRASGQRAGRRGAPPRADPGAQRRDAPVTRSITDAHSGPAPVTPVTSPIGRPSKFPTHTPTAKSAVYPTVQLSRYPVLVPVFAAAGYGRSNGPRPSERRRPRQRVGQDVADHAGHARIEEPDVGRDRVVGRQPQRTPASAAREARVPGGQRLEGDLASPRASPRP